jgi:hypothetical protein
MAFGKNLFADIEKINISYVLNVTLDTNGNPTNLNEVVNAVEAKVNKLKHKGYEYIVLPDSSLIINPFVLGATPLLNNITINERHPTITFALMNIEDDSYRTIPTLNTYKFIDTVNDPALNEQNLRSWLSGSGTVLLVYENGDPASEQILAYWVAACVAVPVSYLVQPLIWTGTQFLATGSNSLASVLSDINALVTGSAVLFMVNGATTHQNGLATGLNWAGITATGITYAGVNFEPVTVTIPVNLQFGLAISYPRSYSKFLVKELHFPATFTAIATFLPNYSYIEAMAFFSRGCKNYKGTSGLIKFDNFHGAIAPYLISSYLPAGMLAGNEVYSDLQENGRWTAETFTPQNELMYI